MIDLGIGNLVQAWRIIFLEVIQKKFYDSCTFPFGPIEMAGQVLGVIEFVGVGSSCTLQYAPNETLQFFSASSLCLHMSSLGLHLAEKCILAGNAFSHIVTNCTKFTTICFGRCVKGNVASIPLHCSFTVLILPSTSATCSFVALMLTFTWGRTSVSFQTPCPLIGFVL